MTRTHLDLFSGIGGFALACRWAGVQTVGFAEIDDYASRVLAKNFPGVTNYGDVRNVPAEDSAIWLVTGGFPCQPFSIAGKQRGASDDRWIWPEMAGVIERTRPAWVLAENVPGIIRMELDTVLSDLERLDYTAWPVVVPAVGVDAPHRRERVWIVGNASSSGFAGVNRRRAGAQLANGRADVSHADESHSGRRANQSQRETQKRTTANRHSQDVPNADGARLERRCVDRQRAGEWATGSSGESIPCYWQPEPQLGRVAHGVPRRVDRLRGLGNAIVPQVAYQLICMMIAAEGE